MQRQWLFLQHSIPVIKSNDNNEFRNRKTQPNDEKTISILKLLETKPNLSKH